MPTVGNNIAGNNADQKSDPVLSKHTDNAIMHTTKYKDQNIIIYRSNNDLHKYLYALMVTPSYKIQHRSHLQKTHRI